MVGLQHAVLAARAVVADYSDHKTRATKLGYIGLAYGLGFAVGPWLGGFIADTFSLQTAAWFACVGSLVSVLLVLFFLPSGRPTQQGSEAAEGKAAASSATKKKNLSLKVFYDVMRYPNVPSLLIVKFLASVPSVSNQTQVASACVFLWLVLPLCIVCWAFLAILSSQTSCHSFHLSTSDALVVVIVMMQAMMQEHWNL